MISKVETDQTITTKAELTRWANERLNIHAMPVVTIDVEGIELSRQTGEKLDGLTLGRQCFVPLAEFGTEILETISELNYKDKIAEPEVFRATLANSRQDVTKILAEEIKRGGGGGRAAARQQKEDHAWFEDTTERVSMVASNLKDAEARIDVQQEEISLKVSKDGVIQAIRVSPEGVQIQASRVDLGDYATVGELNAVKGDFDELTSGATVANTLKTHLLSADTGFTYQGHSISFKTVTIDGVTYHLMGY